MNLYEQKPWIEKYESGVPEAIEYNGQLTHEMLDASAQTYANQVATRLLLSYLPLGITVQATQTYTDLKDSVDRFAFALRKIGLQQGDRIAIMLPQYPPAGDRLFRRAQGRLCGGQHESDLHAARAWPSS